MDLTKNLRNEIEDLKREIKNVEQVLENSPDVIENRSKKEDTKLTTKSK